MSKRLLLALILAGVLMAGCSASSGKSGAVQAVEQYYQAILDQNADKLSSLTCASFEDQARTELDSFQGVKIEMQGLSCKETGSDGSTAQVKCDGKIVATYGNEKMDFPLSDRVHTVQKQGADWLVCGY